VTRGYAQLCAASVCLCAGELSACAGWLEAVKLVAATTDDPLLELQLDVGQGALLCQLRDLAAAAARLRSALDLLDAVDFGADVRLKYRSCALCLLAQTHRRWGLVDIAKQHCEVCNAI